MACRDQFEDDLIHILNTTQPNIVHKVPKCGLFSFILRLFTSIVIQPHLPSTDGNFGGIARGVTVMTLSDTAVRNAKPSNGKASKLSDEMDGFRA